MPALSSLVGPGGPQAGKPWNLLLSVLEGTEIGDCDQQAAFSLVLNPWPSPQPPDRRDKGTQTKRSFHLDLHPTPCPTSPPVNTFSQPGKG